MDPREVQGITVVGPDLFATDPQGSLLGPVASVFPAFRILVTGRGIHSLQVEKALDVLRRRSGPDTPPAFVREQEERLYRDAVALLVRDSVVLIRSEPRDMARIFAADGLLQRLLPKERIQFTGIHLEEVRRSLRLVGASWRISAPPTSLEEIGRYLRETRVRVGTGAAYYQNAHTGGRFLTCEEFTRIRPLLRQDREEALARLKEIVDLSRSFNHQGVRELSPLLPAGEALNLGRVGQLTAALERPTASQDLRRAEHLFDGMARSFAEAAGPELVCDCEEHMTWRKTLFCRVSGIEEKTLEEWSLGLSPEFHLNVRWLPGASIAEGRPGFEIRTEARVRRLIEHFWKTHAGLVSVNVGRVEASQTERDRTGEEREVYLVVLGQAQGRERIRLVRMMKWDVLHRLKRGASREQAVAESNRYRDYIFDRLRAFEAFEIPIPVFTEIRLEEEVPGLGPIPVYFFDRRYVEGIATDKIPPGRYEQPGFTPCLTFLLGRAAAVSLALGRASPRTGSVFFDDGDEVVQLDEEGSPENLMITETTGSFTDWTTPVAEMLPQCLSRLAAHLDRARSRGIAQGEVADAVRAFARGFGSETGRLQQCLAERPAALWGLYDDRSLEPGGIRGRWQAMLERLQATGRGQIQDFITRSDQLAPFREERPASNTPGHRKGGGPEPT